MRGKISKIIGLVVLGIAVLFSSCSQQEVQVVDEFYENGQAKIVMTYLVKMGDSIPVYETQYHKDGAVLLEGNYENGLREGEWISHFSDGSIWSKGFFSKGKRTGKSWVYHPNGQLRMKGKYLNGTKTGKWIMYDENGVIITEQEF